MSTLKIEAVGPSYRVTIGSVAFLFRDIRTDVAVSHEGRHLFRSTSTLSITGRNNIARTALAMDGEVGNLKDWQKATYAAVESVMDAIEQLAVGKDLRESELTSAKPAWTVRPFWPDTTGFLIMPGEAGKSTVLRALAVSIVTGREIIPGFTPLVQGPVLYVVSENPSERSHAASVEAICRGAGLDRGTLPHRILFVSAKGRPLHKLSRSLAEQAHDCAAVMLDSQQGFLSLTDQGNIRDQAAMFWNAVDELDKPAFVIAHPNREEATHWDRSEGRAAGAEVNRDRPRISWAGHWTDEPAIVGTSFRRTTFTCTKYNEGPHPAPLSFGVGWQFPMGDGDPGTVTFTACEAVETHQPRGEAVALTKAVQETLDPQSWRRCWGAPRTPPRCAVEGCSSTSKGPRNEGGVQSLYPGTMYRVPGVQNPLVVGVCTRTRVQRGERRSEPSQSPLGLEVASCP